MRYMQCGRISFMNIGCWKTQISQTDPGVKHENGGLKLGYRGLFLFRCLQWLSLQVNHLRTFERIQNMSWHRKVSNEASNLVLPQPNPKPARAGPHSSRNTERVMPLHKYSYKNINILQKISFSLLWLGNSLLLILLQPREIYHNEKTIC